MSAKELATTSLYTSEYLKGYYRFSTGELTVDSSGEGHTLTAISDPAEDTGKFGGAVLLDGDDAYSIVDHADFKPTSNFTIGCWMKTSTTGTQMIMLQSYSQNTLRAGILIATSTANKLNVLVGRNTGGVSGTDYISLVGATSICNGLWNFITTTWDGSYLRIYVNGKLDLTESAWTYAPGYAATNYVNIGCRNNAGTNSNYFTGSLDDVFILNGTALSSDEIAGLYLGSKSFNGLGLASVKKSNGLAFAGIKSINQL